MEAKVHVALVLVVCQLLLIKKMPRGCNVFTSLCPLLLSACVVRRPQCILVQPRTQTSGHFSTVLWWIVACSLELLGALIRYHQVHRGVLSL